jgi:HTH-type transcriptional regulator / antitoxin HipB
MIVHSANEMAESIRDRRKRQQLSQSEVGDRVGMKQATVSAFENKPASTKLETLFKILAALDLELQIVPRGSVQARSGWDQEW